PHSNVRMVGAVAPGCTTAGYSGDTVCESCGRTVAEGKTLPAAGHKTVSDKAVAATCTAAGKTAGEHCSVCGAVLQAQQTVPALGHVFTDNVVAPTYTSQGYTGHTCSRCGYSYKDSYVDKLVDPNAIQGSGTASDPYRVATAAQLNKVRDYLSKKGLYFVQTANIDLGSYSSWVPIGSESAPFRNNFNGNGFSITGLKIEADDESCTFVGLFGSVREATFANLNVTGAEINGAAYNCGILSGCFVLSKVENCSVSGTLSGRAQYGCGYFGGLVGKAEGSTFTGCRAEVTLLNGAENVGGLIGFASAFYNETTDKYTAPSVSRCASSGEIRGGSNVGGLIGNDSDASVTRSSSTASVTASGINAGGLIGLLDDISNDVSAPEVSFCFATGSVRTTGTGYGAAFCGGLVGHGTFDNVIHDCYATGDVVCSGSWSDCQDNWMSQVWLRYRNPAGALIGCMESTFHVKSDDSRYALTVYNCYASGSVTFLSAPWVSDTAVANGSLIGCVYDRHTYYNCKSGSAEGKEDVFFGQTEHNYCVGTSREYYLAIPRYGRTLPAGEETRHTVVANVTADRLSDSATFAGFDFSTVWKMGASSPELRDCASVSQ
ncbi:MAG: hypothetical protein J6V01_02370, partial [Clostridia bacterium]|nr:hypothetical protein [Clostridia bacterium]